MGDTLTTSFGYGVKLQPLRYDRYDYLFDVLPENYPLLQNCWAGDGRFDGPPETWIFVKSTLVQEFGYRNTGLTSDNFIVPAEGAVELNRFIKDTPLTDGKAQWAILSHLW